MKRKKGINTDHLGNIYKDQEEMCRAYGITENIFIDRLKRGRTIEEALTNPIKKNGKNALSEIKDHKGKKYQNIAKMAKAWGLPAALARDRLLNKNWSVKKALETPKEEHNHQVTDSKGKTYPSWNAYARAKGLTRNVVLKMRKKGYTIEEIDNYKMKDYRKACTDHKGNEYNSIADMCRTYNLPPDQYRLRIDKLGWSKEKALETPLRKHHSYTDEEMTDSKGKRWESLRAYSVARGWSENYALQLIKKGLTLKDLDDYKVKARVARGMV